MTARERYTLAGAADLIPNDEVDITVAYLPNVFWSIRRFCGEWSEPVTPRMILDYEEFSGYYLSQDERAIICEMDLAYRISMADFRAECDKKRNKG